jgi:hypothetical protein
VLLAARSSRFKVKGSKFKVQSSRFKVQGSKFKVQSSRFKVQGSRSKVWSDLVGFSRIWSHRPAFPSILPGPARRGKKLPVRAALRPDHLREIFFMVRFGAIWCDLVLFGRWRHRGMEHGWHECHGLMKRTVGWCPHRYLPLFTVSHRSLARQPERDRSAGGFQRKGAKAQRRKEDFLQSAFRAPHLPRPLLPPAKCQRTGARAPCRFHITTLLWDCK